MLPCSQNTGHAAVVRNRGKRAAAALVDLAANAGVGRAELDELMAPRRRAAGSAVALLPTYLSQIRLVQAPSASGFNLASATARTWLLGRSLSGRCSPSMSMTSPARGLDPRPSVWFLLVCGLGAPGVAVAKRCTELTIGRRRRSALAGDALIRRVLRMTQVVSAALMLAMYLMWASGESAGTSASHVASAAPLALARFGVVTARQTARLIEDMNDFRPAERLLNHGSVHDGANTIAAPSGLRRILLVA
jgi:hypothetical protein